MIQSLFRSKKAEIKIEEMEGKGRLRKLRLARMKSSRATKKTNWEKIKIQLI